MILLNRPVVSIVISIYNGENVIRRALDSCIFQTMPDFELIAINDGSTDNTLNVLLEYEKKDKRILIIDRENRGLSASINEGVSLAKGFWIARMDADDVSLPNRLEKQIAYLTKHEDIDVLGSCAYLQNGDGQYLGISCLPQNHDELIRIMHKASPFIHPSVVFRRDSFVREGGFREDLRRAQDYELWSRMAGKYRFHNLQEPLIIYTYRERLNIQSLLSAARVRFFVGIRLGKPFSGAFISLRSLLVGMLVILRLYRRRTSRGLYANGRRPLYKP